MISNIINEMVKGNFSFLILVVGIAQLVLMAINLKLALKSSKNNKKKKK